jgi:hypothetical protein
LCCGVQARLKKERGIICGSGREAIAVHPNVGVTTSRKPPASTKTFFGALVASSLTPGWIPFRRLFLR